MLPTSLDLSFLQAADELVRRQQELLPLVAEQLEMDPWKYWLGRCHPSPEEQPESDEEAEQWFEQQLGHTADRDWEWFFHGSECDIQNVDDGRMVRVDFGPGGRWDCFGGWGVLQFVMSSRPPWRVFPELQEYLADKPPPYDAESGSNSRMWEINKRLEAMGLVQAADLQLARLKEECTTIASDGSRQINLPEPLTAELCRNVMVCERHVISARGRELLGREG